MPTLLLSLLLATFAAPQVRAEPEIEGKVRAVIDHDRSLEIDFARDDQDWQTFAIIVEEDVAAVDIALSGANGDLDLYARWGGQMESYEQADHAAESPRGDETLRLSRQFHPRLRTGVYYMDVCRREQLPRSATLSISFERGFEPDETYREAPRPGPSDDPLVFATVTEDALFTVPLANDDEQYQTIRIDVPDRTHRVLIEACGAHGDIDLHAKQGDHLADWDEDPEFSANSSAWQEQLVLEGEGRYLKSDSYYVDIVNFDYLPGVGPVEIWIDFDPETVDPLPASNGEMRVLEPGVPVAASIDRLERVASRFRFEVPPGTERLEVLAFDASRDVDLFLRAGEPITSYDEGEEGYDYRRYSARLDEHFVLTAEPDESLEAGWWYLDVASMTVDDQRIEYRLVIALDEEIDIAPIDWDRYLPHQDDSRWNPLERALLATVEITCENGSGSGTCISPKGYMLTNYHVLDGDDSFQINDIYISLTHDFREVPHQLFTAEVIEADADLDLVLLHLTGDVYGRPLPENLTLPFLVPTDTRQLKLGTPLYVVGFPAVGGDENRYSLSLTRGVLTGFSRDPYGRLAWIKTDARINSGNSGGTLLTGDELKFVGVPSREIVVEDDQLGYSRPLELLPEAWKVHLE